MTPGGALCSNLAILVVNDDNRQDYDSSFWTDEATSGSAPTDCFTAWNGDAKSSKYYSEPVGSKITIVAKDASNVVLATAEYPVLTAYQGYTLKQLLNGEAGNDLTFTENKNPSNSFGNLRDDLPMRVDQHGGGQNTNSDLGDVFFDMDYPLVANAVSGFNSQTTQIRLASGAKDFLAGKSNGHWFGGIGGIHVQGGWGASYEAMPSYPYCSGYNIYGNNNGASDGNCAGYGGNSVACSHNSCMQGSAGNGYFTVNFGIYVDTEDMDVS
jgi:hypothetical protein